MQKQTALKYQGKDNQHEAGFHRKKEYSPPRIEDLEAKVETEGKSWNDVNERGITFGPS